MPSYWLPDTPLTVSVKITAEIRTMSQMDRGVTQKTPGSDGSTASLGAKVRYRIVVTTQKYLLYIPMENI